MKLCFLTFLKMFVENDTKLKNMCYTLNKEKIMKQPKFYIFLKILGFILCITGIVFIVITVVSGFKDEYAIFFALSFLLFLLAFYAFFIGFQPEAEKHRLNVEKYILEKTKDIQEDMISKDEDIRRRGAYKRYNNVFHAFNEEEVCPTCNKPVNENQDFCPQCGTKLHSICKKCGLNNELKNDFCKNCGNKLN